MSDYTRITVSAIINKPMAHVWNTWTDPKHITQWCAASDDRHCPKATNDLKSGGNFNSTMAAKDGSFSFDLEGVYDDVQLNKRIAYTMALHAWWNRSMLIRRTRWRCNAAAGRRSSIVSRPTLKRKPETERS